MGIKTKILSDLSSQKISNWVELTETRNQVTNLKLLLREATEIKKEGFSWAWTNLGGGGRKGPRFIPISPGNLPNSQVE